MKLARIDGTGADYAIVAGAHVGAVSVFADGYDIDGLIRATGSLWLRTDPLGLGVGDLYNGIHWTRNVDGEQMTLPIEADSLDAEEAIAILLGEVD